MGSSLEWGEQSLGLRKTGARVEGPAAYQLVGGVTAYRGGDG